MARQPETVLVENMKRAIIKRYPSAWVFKVAGGVYQNAGVPDLLVCIDGRLYAIEAKRQGAGETADAARRRVTPRQEAQIAALRRAGAKAAVALTVEDALRIIEPYEEDET